MDVGEAAVATNGTTGKLTIEQIDQAPILDDVFSVLRGLAAEDAARGTLAATMLVTGVLVSSDQIDVTFHFSEDLIEHPEQDRWGAWLRRTILGGIAEECQRLLDEDAQSGEEAPADEDTKEE